VLFCAFQSQLEAKQRPVLSRERTLAMGGCGAAGARCPPARSPAAAPCCARHRWSERSRVLACPHQLSPVLLPLLPSLGQPPVPEVPWGEGDGSGDEPSLQPARPALQPLPGRQGTHSSDASRRASCPAGHGRQPVQLVVLGGERRQTALQDGRFPDQPSLPRPPLVQNCGTILVGKDPEDHGVQPLT